MSVTDEKTVNRNYPLPHHNNYGVDDVERIREAMRNIDSDVQALGTSKEDKSTVATMQTEISRIRALTYSNL
jgi:hypothetical protein